MAPRLTVGVVSDTHGLVRPEALEALRGSDVILHAGDIGGSHVLAGARRARAGASPCAATWTAAGRACCRSAGGSTSAACRVLILHDRALLGLDPAEEGLGVVVFGHSHQPLAEKRKGVLWFNPGSAGPRRFRLPVSVGRLVIEDGRVRHRLVTLG